MKELLKKVKEKGFAGTAKAIQAKTRSLSNRLLLSVKLSGMLEQERDRLEKRDILEIRDKTLRYIDEMRIKKKPFGRYKYCGSQTEAVLYASCYAALTRHLYRDFDNLVKGEREEWIDYIKSFQDEDGLFKDPSINNDISEDSDWWGWRHLTLHALMALTVLGAVPDKSLKIIDPFKGNDFIVDWLGNRDWTVDPATTSNQVQNYLTILQYARDYCGADLADKSLEAAYKWLTEKQNKATGTWGHNFDTPLRLSHGVQTGYHIWLLYFYDNKPIQCVEQIIDSCLATQNKFGGFGVVPNSSACEDIDSIDPLIRLTRTSSYRREEVRSGLQKAIPWILLNMNEDGGFVFRRMEPFVYGHVLMSSGKDESAMFPTWFRTLSMAYLAKIFPESFLGRFDWQFMKCPGLQFWNIQDGRYKSKGSKVS